VGTLVTSEIAGICRYPLPEAQYKDGRTGETYNTQCWVHILHRSGLAGWLHQNVPFLIGYFETRADDSQIDFDYASNTLNEEKPKMGTPTDTTS
jgi:hypothetical protein